MLRVVLATFLSLVALAALAQDPRALPRDEKIEMLANDLRTLGRIVGVAQDLPQSRQVMLAIIDSDIRTLREARDDGTYRWAS
ncbi:MAG TPA: hypothetical protein VHL59_15775, partial [Thermoanaerobaculia bacterium]|nr:hypothetical protein [Thermoanaerobaculia bacterium]